MSRLDRMWKDLDQDIREHIAMETQDNIDRGMSPEAAQRAAFLKFGNVTRIEEETREVWSGLWLEQVAQDLRYAFRMLRRAPGFTTIAILTIALGIGATTAIFSVVDATLLHPLPYPHPEQLVSVEADLPGVGAHNVGVSVPEWWDLARSGIFQYVSPIGGGDVNLTGASQPERIRFLAVPPNYLTLLGVKPELGRTFNPDDQTPGFTLEVVISHGLWKRAFGGDPAILGKSLRLDNDLYHIIGVMPASFHDPGRTAEDRNIEVWAAAGFAGAPAPAPQRNLRILPEAVARMQPGLTIAAAQSRVDVLVAALQRQYPVDYPPQSGWRVRLVPLQESVVGNVRSSLILLLGAVALVLLIGCVNIANLLLARASARGREMALRQALGAARRRLIRQLLTESLLLSFLGGLAGLAILFCVKGLLLRMLPASLGGINEISIDWMVLLFALAASLLVGVIFGLTPALHVGRADLTGALKEAARGSTASGEQARTRRILVVTEFGLSLVLMIAAGLLLRSFWDLLNVRPGFDSEHVMAVRTWLPVPNDPTTDIYRTAAQEAPFLREVVRRAKTLPGVEEAAVGDVASVPLGHGVDDLNPFEVILEGRDTQADQPPLVDVAIVSPEYFHLLGMPLLRGRLFNGSDDENAPQVAVINESFARTYCADSESHCDHIKLNNTRGMPNDAWITVVGVVADARTESLAQPGIPQVYTSAYQRISKDLAIFVRGTFESAEFPPDLRRQVQLINPELPVFGARMLSQVVSSSLAERRFALQMVGLFALTALVLAALGIYGVISYIVTERTHEIGIRLTLGAHSRNILRMVLQQGLRLALAGTAVGLVGALIVSRLMAELLFGVRPTDPLTFLAVALLLVGVALLACFIPAWRAMRIDPMVALRYE